MRNLRLSVFIMTAIVCGATVALAIGLLDLPLGQVVAFHGPWNAGTLGSTLDITLAAVPDGHDVTNGSYTGWCAEDNFQPDLPDGTLVYLFDSTDDPENLTCGGYSSIEWDKVNYLLNNKAGTIQDVQVAMWLLTGTYAGTFPVTAAAQAMFDDANSNGDGFQPIPGQLTAVILCGDGFGPAGFQETLIEVMVPPDDFGDACTPGYWRNTRKHLDDWLLAGYHPGDSFDAAMGGCVSTGLTMGQAVRQRGGKEGKLIRFGAASLLNAENPFVDFGLTEEEVRAGFCAAYTLGDWTLFDLLFDNEECPL